MEKFFKSPCKNKSINAHHKLFLCFLILNLMAISLISAQMGFDNTKSFDKNVGNYGRVTIKDWFGLLNLTELELKKNTDVCLIECSAEKEIIMYQKGSLIDDIKFETINWDNSRTKEPIRDYQFYIKQGNRIKEYNLGDEVEPGTYTVILEGRKSPLKKVDWIIQSQGEWIDDWAIWDTNPPLAYYDFNSTAALENRVNASEGNGTKIGSITTDQDVSLIPEGWQFTASDDQWVNITQSIGGDNMTVMMWVQPNWSADSPTGDNIVFFYGRAGKYYLFYGNDGNLYAKAGDQAGGIPTPDFGTNWTAGDWVMLTMWWSNSANEFKVYINDELAMSNISNTITYQTEYMGLADNPAGNINFYGNISETGIWNSTLTETEISELYNSGSGFSYRSGVADITVNLTSPINNENISLLGTDFIAYHNATNCYLTNYTYYFWDSTGAEYNNTINGTITGETNITTGTVHFFNLGEYDWNVWACCLDPGISSDCDFDDTNRSFTVNEWGEISQTFNQSIYEIEFGYFEIVSEYNSSAWTAISADLNYNGTDYSGTQVGTGDDITFTHRLDMPSITSPQNRTFYWNTSLTNDTNTYYFRSKTNTHLVNTMAFYLCNSTYNVTYLNFTAQEAINPYQYLNATFKMSWTIDSTTNGSWENISELQHNWSFCAEPAFEEYQIDATIEYDGTGWAKNFYYLNNATITNASSEISLYLLNDSDATATVLEVIDRSRSPIADVYIQIQSYDVGTDTYYTTATAKTAENGEDLVYLNWYDTLYKFILTQNDEVVLSTSPYKISETPQTFEVVDEVVFEFEKFENFIYNLYYNETTKNFVLTFTKPSGDVEAACLRVTKRNITEDTLICLTCEESTSATIYCNVDAYGNGTYIASFYALGSGPKWIDVLIKTIGGISSEIWDTIGNLDGTVMAIIFAGVVMVMFLVSPAIGIIGMLLGVVGAMALGFQPADYDMFFGLAVFGGIVIWLIKR